MFLQENLHENVVFIKQGNKMSKTYRYTETFLSIQGEGLFTGEPSVWLRLFQCNLECAGFGQSDPTDPSTYKLPYEEFDPIDIKVVEELPVWEYGCDSSYSWAKKYRHLAHNKTASEICNELEARMANPHNPEGKFLHPKSKQHTHMCFTGGEPMMQQQGMIDILQEFKSRNNLPMFVTVETNGTQKLRPFMKDFIEELQKEGVEWFWSISPKLFNTSGEPEKRAFKEGVVGSYYEVSNKGQLKYVVNGSETSWAELEERTEMFRKEGCLFDVWVMPVGATVEDQEKTAGDMAVEIIKRGYKVSARVHCYLFGNLVGT